MITLFGCSHFFNFVSFLLYPTEVKRLKCAMLGAFTVTVSWSVFHDYIPVYKVWNQFTQPFKRPTYRSVILYAHPSPIFNGVDVLKFLTIVACQKGLDKQCKPRSDCFFRGSFLFAILASLLWIQALITIILFVREHTNKSVRNF